MSKFVQAVLALCAWIAAATFASAQTPTHDAVDVSACLQSGDDACLVDLILDYAAEGRSQASYMADTLGGVAIMRMLLRRCRPLHVDTLSRLQNLLETTEPTVGDVFDRELESSAEFNWALNLWLTDTSEPFEPLGDLDVFGISLDGTVDQDQAQRMIDLSQIAIVEGACGSRDRERGAVLALLREVESMRASLSGIDRISLLTLHLKLLERLDDDTDASSLTEELTLLIPQLEDPTFGTTIFAMQIIRDHNLDVYEIAARWNNPMFSAIAAQEALARPE